MLGYGMTATAEEVSDTLPPGKRKYAVVIDCGTWPPETILDRLRNGGCPNRLYEWRHIPPGNTVSADIETTKVGVETLREWLQLEYVIPTPLTFSIEPIR